MLHTRRLRLAALALACTLACCTGAARAATTPTETAVLAGGCFWGMEAVFDSVRGVISATPGYAGGSAATAHYDMVEQGTTGHAESVRIVFDPTKISYQRLLDVYFRVAHDPTELNYQGPDVGPQYRSTIFVANADQRRIAEAAIAKYTAEHYFPAPIVTTIQTLHGFYQAEPEHMHFVARHPDNPYVVANDLPKLAALHHEFPNLDKG